MLAEAICVRYEAELKAAKKPMYIVPSEELRKFIEKNPVVKDSNSFFKFDMFRG